MSWCTSCKDGITITLKVTPRASVTRCLGEESEWLRLALQAPPVDGKANAAAAQWLAQVTGLPKRSVILQCGDTARLKRFHLIGITEPELRAKLALN